jgi:predicted SAM-dependent methyltransferase
VDPQILDWIAPFIATHGPFPRVLELGSLNVNGTIRPAFVGTDEYVGLDQRPGDGVDLVMNAHDVEPWTRGRFDCVVASSFFEHDDRFWETLQAVRRVLRPGGWFVLTVPNHEWGYHPEPKDYYRYTDDAIREILFEGFVNVQLANPLWPTPEGMPHLKCQNMGGWGQWP